MRDIKFRGKCIEHGKECGWAYGYLIISAENYSILDEWIKGKGHLKHLVEPQSMGQYTGLKDKNGKEIYEGDILNGGGKIGFASYMNETAEYIIDFWKDGQKRSCGESLGSWIDAETKIIGNMYENPELLSDEHGE